MKAKMQSLHLQEMMQKHKHHPEYDLVLPTFLLKKKNFASMKKNDLLLIGLNHLDLALYQEGAFCAKVLLDSHGETMKLKIASLEEEPSSTTNSKKYESILSSFGKIQSRQLEVGHKVEISVVDLQHVSLYVKQTEVAKATLVMVDEEIALKITEVNNGKR